MIIIKKTVIGFLLGIALLLGAAYIFQYDYLLTAVRTVYFHGHRTAFLDDYQYFENRTIPQSTQPQPWPVSKDYNKVPLSAKMMKWHQKTETVAFLIIKNDSLWSETYFDDYNKNSKSNSFSMAKSVVSAALGKAIQQGKIRSLNQVASNFYPEFISGKSALMTVGDLSSMASGLNWDENYYSPFSITTRAYFDEDLAPVILGQKAIDEPGTRYKYLSGNSQLLAMCIEKATGEELADYVSKNFWQPMGAENQALWQTDHKNGMVKAFCCIASNARDFARFGKLYEHFGNWNGKQILDSTFVARSIKPRFTASPEYGYGWWLASYKNSAIFYMRGHLGQYVIVIPEHHLIIVRLGKNTVRSSTGSPHSDDFWVWVTETFQMIKA